MNSLGELVRARAATHGDRPLFVFGGATTTFGEVEERTNRLANVLREHGVERGDRVAVMLPNGVGFPVAWLAICKLGAVLVPINIAYRSNDLAHLIHDSGAVLALTDTAENAAEMVKAGVGQVGLLDSVDAGPALESLDGTFDAGTELSAASASFELPDVGLDDLANIQYTSGTTGFPKGCMLTHGYWLRLSELAGELTGVRPDDVDLTTQPFSYMDPQWNTALCLRVGIPLVILNRFSASTFWRDVRDHGVTFFYVLGTMPVYLAKQPPDPSIDRAHRVRLVLCSGIVPDLHASFEERWGAPWREAYGMTETGVDLWVPPAETGCVGTGTVGRPVPGKKAKIVDGEIVVQGTPMMLGYWNNPEATAERFRDGWVHTGDLGRMDEDGRFYLVGRKKDMIRRGGDNVAAAEVEAVLAQHPAVRASAAVPVPHPELGEEVKVFVQTGAEVSAAELVDFVRERIAAFKVPRYVEFVDEFPMTPSERIAKHLLPTGREREYDAKADHQGVQK